MDERWHDFDREILLISEKIRKFRCSHLSCTKCPFFHADGWNEDCRFSIGGKDFEKWLTITDKTDEIWRRV